MELLLRRGDFLENSVIGDLFIDGIWECYTLEDKDRFLENSNVKVDKQTAIPRGKYKLILDRSDRFKRITPHILGVPQFTGIRIHRGNVVADTEGCPIVGRVKDVANQKVLESKLVEYALVVKLIEFDQKNENMFIEIV